MRRPARRRDRLLGWGLTGLLALAGLAAGGALLVGLVLFVVAMPLTSAVIAAVVLWGGWRMVAQRRRARR